MNIIHKYQQFKHLYSRPTADVTVRIRRGYKSNEGRVEVFHNGEWGTICDSNWDIQDAEVVCRMLGYEGAWSTECCAWYGPGQGEIWLNQVNCIGDEASISHCRHGGWGNHACSHRDDVGVTCKYTPPASLGMELICDVIPKMVDDHQYKYYVINLSNEPYRKTS